MGRNLTRWLIPLPAILFAVFPQTANAEPVLGLNAVGYTISEIPPTRSDTIYQTCGNETENNINRNFNGEPFQQCGDDLFMIHYTGFITIPENDTIQFMVAADDGGTIQIGETLFGTWEDKGCSWSEITTDSFDAGVFALDGWFYENGGSTCFMLAWNIDDEGWAIVPDEAFTTNGVSTTTTSTSTTSTTTTTTTTLPETTTSASTSTLVQESSTTTSLVQSSTTSQTTTTSTTPATTTTTTAAPYTPPQTSTTEPEPEPTTTTTTSETTTTTTSLPESTTTETTEETFVQTTVAEPEPESSTTTEPSDSTLANETETTLPLPPDDDSEASNAIVEPVFEIETEESGEISDKVFDQILEAISEATPEKVVAIVEAILETKVSQEQAIELVTSPEVLAAVTEQQAEQIFEQIAPEELSEAQAEAITEAVQNAPNKVKKAFENIINIFGSQFESYRALGSNIPVSQRRSLIAIGSLFTMMPPPVRIKQ